jgi:hypothetical protein
VDTGREIVSDRPVGVDLDRLRVVADLDDDDVISGAVVLLSVLEPSGQEALVVGASDGLSMIAKQGLISSAYQSAAAEWRAEDQ